MAEILPELLWIAILVLVNAFFAASEIAVIAARDARIHQLAEEGHRGARVAQRLMADPSRFLATIQVGITLAGFLASASAAVTLAQPVAAWLRTLGLAPGVATSVAVTLVTVVISYVTLVLGELAPKRLALQNPEGLALRVARPIAMLARLAAPFTALLARSTNLVVRALGGRADVQERGLTEEEIRFYVAEHQDLRSEEKQLIEGVFDFGDRIVRQVMVPRPEMHTLPRHLSLSQAVERALRAGFEHYPVTGEGPDDIVGQVSTHDLLRAMVEGDGPDTVEGLLQPVRFVPETKPALDLLKEMKRDRFRLAVVVDEYGGVAGLVTLDDLLDEIVGEMAGGLPGGRQVTASEWVLEGDTSIEDANERLDLDIPASPHYETVAGFVLYNLGRLPEPGEGFEHRGWYLSVERREGLRIAAVRVRKLAGALPAPGGPAAGSGTGGAGEGPVPGGGGEAGRGSGGAGDGGPGAGGPFDLRTTGPAAPGPAER
ncbi:HlyC/CorC family transporter [Thermaerobacter sp. PB12/4term]|uniref:hemolysin family protein n=1 Tax=Thermaerobacter sp. PB12/4term TaxID=2293838 RepID=UPI0013148642|nr:hemolysin family protein [Thermaerobacter sp. PB12/4term]QIA26773.1 HlyC/CorC family transporter [Thermaerobacter sp. PB12/4term]